MSESKGAPRLRRRPRLSPVGWFLVLMLGGYVLVTAVLYWVMASSGQGLSLIFGVFLLYDFALYVVYFWLAVYCLLEFQLWRRMRNEGHLLQFLGSLLILAPISWALITSGLSSASSMFSLARVALTVIEFFALVAGASMALYGYYHRRFHASDVDLYRNVVVRSGEKIGLLTDGYSSRAYQTRYEGFPGDAVRARADEYATRFQRGGFLLFHRMDATGVTLYPITYTGVGGFRLITAFAHVYRLWRQPDRLTWVRVDWTGDVQVHISPEDYARIKRPVAHHVLCAGVADAIAGSLLAYARGDEAQAVQSLLGPEPVRRPEDLQLPLPRRTGAGWVALGLAAILLVAGTGAAISADLGLGAPPGPSIQGVYWRPANPVGGQPIDLFANLTGLNPFYGPVDNFGVTVWAYYNASVYGARYLANIEGDQYGVRLGSFPNGTEITFVLQASQMAGGTEIYSTSPAYVLDVGTVHRGGASQLSIQGASLELDSLGGATFGAWINASAALETTEVLFSGYCTYSGSQGSGGGGLQIAGVNLTASGAHYRSYAPLLTSSVIASEHLHLVVWYKFVVRDVLWNTASTPLLTFEVSR